jgi:hypothetical protein
MAENIPEEILIELDQIVNVVKRLGTLNQKVFLNDDEVNSAALMLVNFYNGIENIFKQLIRIHKIPMPTGERWHKELLDLILSEKWISSELYDNLMQYMKFRHFIIHSYTFHINPAYMMPLVENVFSIHNLFLESIRKIF